MADASSECVICVETFNRTSRARISCVKCDFECCKVCFKRYTQDPEHLLQCMACHVTFDRTSLFTRLGKSWMATVYRDIRENVLYEQEKALFPAAQETIEQELEIRRLHKKRDGLDKKYDQIRKDRMVPLAEFRQSTEVMKVREAIDQYSQMIANIEIVDEQLQDERSLLSTKIYELQNNKRPAKVSRTYVLACTAANCKGMLSSEKTNQHGHYICAICDSTTCRDCRMQIPESDHTCDPDILKTVTMMANSSKPCPSCGVPIFKISGCDQMFCTSCHASFSWRTLRLNNGAVHNPHHAEWLRANRNRGRETRDVQCGREPTMAMAVDVSGYMDDAIEKALKEREYSFKEERHLRIEATALFEYMRWSIHHHHVTIPSLSVDRNNQQTNMRLRVNLLTEVISESEFKKLIQRRDKLNSKRAELLQVCLTYRDALADLIAPFIEGGEEEPAPQPTRRGRRANRERPRPTHPIHPIEDWLQLLNEVRGLERYVNQCFQNIADTYGTVAYEIGDDRTIR